MTKAREIAELGQKLTVDASGNLDIAGDVTADRINVGDQAATYTIQAFDNSGNTPISFALGEQPNTARAFRIEKVDESDADPYAANIYFSDHATSNTGSLNFFSSQEKQNILRLNANGNIGMGTTSPNYKLVVSDGGAAGIEFGPEYAGDTNLVQHYDRTVNAYMDVNHIAQNHRFGRGSSEWMRITNTGKVGIGETDPQALVHINDLSSTGPVLMLEGGSSVEGDLVVPSGEILQVGHWDDGTATFTNRLNIATNGDVGLGTDISQSTATSGAGHFFGNTGYAVHARERSNTSDNILILNDTGNVDGALIDLRRDGSTGGRVGFANLGQNRNLFVGHGDTGLSFQGHTDNAITPMSTSGLNNSDGVINLGAQGSKFNAVWTNSIRTSNNVLTISVDDDGSGANQAIYFREGGVTRVSMEDNDFFVSDNINSGLRYESGGANRAYDVTASHISAYAANTASPDTAGFQSYRTFIQAYNTTDPDVAIFQAFSKDVMADTGATSHNEQATAHMLDNSGRVWSWSTQYAGQVRVGTTATTRAYRAGDSAFTAYSGTGNSHGAGSYAGFTQIVGRESANGDDVFLVTTAGQHRIEFDADGNGRFDGGADISAADYAEYFEWQDGNPNNEDRRGHSVVLNSDGTIRIATASDPVDDIIGIVSVEAAVVGDSAWAAWTGKYERDRFGQTVYEDYDLLCWGPYDEDTKSYKTQTTRQAMIDAGREDEIPEDAITVTKQRKKLAADYDPDREYIPRKDRQEWVAIGLMGKLPLFDGQPTGPRWRKLYDLNDEVEMWLVR